jgi:hypothetical protein
MGGVWTADVDGGCTEGIEGGGISNDGGGFEKSCGGRISG